MNPSPRNVVVRGRVVDDLGAPIAGASITVSTELSHRDGPVTDANGEFSVTVPETPAVRLVASHPDFGLQYTDMTSSDWSRYDVPPPPPHELELTLHRGLVLRGRVVDASGAPMAHETLLLVYDYEGSGPHPLETTTDADGGFSFPRAVLRGFELVVRSLDHWQPQIGDVPGDYLRVVPQRDEWLAHARLDEPVTVTVVPFTLVPVTVAVVGDRGQPLANADVDLWVRSGPDEYVGTMPHTDAEGRCRTLMETGVAYDLWVAPNRGARTAPWTESIAPRWHGAIEVATTLRVAIP
jgi:protocatechuate 3,4-dioxygenase beta subunit